MHEVKAYYNEIDPFAAKWLRSLIDAGHIAKGDVDERSIVDVQPSDLKGYNQCHFFAGIGVWSHALRKSGWNDDKHVWTGSCPCQPFSAAGKGAGQEDKRHLWPEFYRLIRECKPSVVFGEQVAAAIGHAWLDSLQSDMEGEGYAVGKAVLGACSVGAPHIRQRLYFVADSKGTEQQCVRSESCRLQGRSSNSSVICDLAESGSFGRQWGKGSEARRDNERQNAGREQGDDELTGYDKVSSMFMGDTSISSSREYPGSIHSTKEECNREGQQDGCVSVGFGAANTSLSVALGDSNYEGLEGRSILSECTGELASGSSSLANHGLPGPTNGFWSDADWLRCRDGKWRPVEPNTFPLAYGSPARVGRLRGYGNAICSEVAKEFISSYLEAKGESLA